MLKKLVAAAAIVLALVSSASGISDIGRSEITRVWKDGNEGRRFVCSASYIFPYIDENRSWLLSAGHCAGADTAARTASATVWGVINWRAVIDTHGENGTGIVDIALGTVPEVRDGATKRLWLAEKLPDAGEGYIHGYPAGVESVVRAIIVPPAAAERISFLQPVATPFGVVFGQRVSFAQAYPGARLMITPPKQVGPGSSGSAILDGQDRVIAVLWGGLENDFYKVEGLPERVKDWDVILVTPVDAVHALFKSLGVK